MVAVVFLQFLWSSRTLVQGQQVVVVIVGWTPMVHPIEGQEERRRHFGKPVDEHPEVLEHCAD